MKADFLQLSLWIIIVKLNKNEKVAFGQHTLKDVDDGIDQMKKQMIYNHWAKERAK